MPALCSRLSASVPCLLDNARTGRDWGEEREGGKWEEREEARSLLSTERSGLCALHTAVRDQENMGPVCLSVSCLLLDNARTARGLGRRGRAKINPLTGSCDAIPVAGPVDEPEMRGEDDQHGVSTVSQ